jgi:hypothetical protein
VVRELNLVNSRAYKVGLELCGPIWQVSLLSLEPTAAGSPLYAEKGELTWDHSRGVSELTRTRDELPRKEVIQPQLPLRLPCYDFVPVINPTLGRCPLAHEVQVSLRTSGVVNSHDVTGGVYKTREHIHRAMLTRGY